MSPLLRAGFASLLALTTSVACTSARPNPPGRAPVRTTEQSAPAPGPASGPRTEWFVPYLAPVTISEGRIFENRSPWSPDGALAWAEPFGGGEVLLFQTAAAAPVAVLPLARDETPMRWSLDSRYVAAVARTSGRIAVFDVLKRARVLDFHAPATPLELVGWLADGRRLAVRSSTSLLVFDAFDGRLLLAGPETRGQARLSPRRPWLAYERESGGIGIFDLDTGKLIFEDERDAAPSVWFSDGTKLFARARNFGLIVAPGSESVVIPASGEVTWDRTGTRVALDAESIQCRGCLRPSRADATYDARTGRPVASDGFVPDGARFGAFDRELQDRATGEVRSVVPPPIVAEKVRSVRLDDDRTLLVDTAEWAARIDLASGRSSGFSEDGPDDRWKDLDVAVSCSGDRWTVRQRVGRTVLGSVDRPCADARLQPMALPLFQYRSTNDNEVLDLSTGAKLASFPREAVPFPYGKHLATHAGDERRTRCIVFDGERPRLLETPFIPISHKKLRCEYWGSGVVSAVVWENSSATTAYTWLEGRGFVGADGAIGPAPRAFCSDTYGGRDGITCLERAGKQQELRAYYPGFGVRRLTIRERRSLHDLVASPDRKRLAFRSPDGTFVADFATGVTQAWGPPGFVPKSFAADGRTLRGEMATFDGAGRVNITLRPAILRDGHELAAPAEPTPPHGWPRWLDYVPSPSGRIGVFNGVPLTLVRFADHGTLRLILARAGGRIHSVIVDSAGHYAGDPELERLLVYASGTSPFDARLIPATEASPAFRQPAAIRDFFAHAPQPADP